MYLLNPYLLRAYYVPGHMLDVGQIKINNSIKAPAFMKLTI